MTDRYERIRAALAMRPTPGPWEVVNGTDVFTQIGARNAAGVEAAANDGWHIADCDMGPSSTEEGKADIPCVEKRVNAAFIAACDPETISELLADRDALAAEVERLRKALEEIANLSERPYDKFPSDWLDQIAACPECQRYKDHPIQQGICDDHRKHLYDRDDHNRHETFVLGYRAKSIAREALAARRVREGG